MVSVFSFFVVSSEKRVIGFCVRDFALFVHLVIAETHGLEFVYSLVSGRVGKGLSPGPRSNLSVGRLEKYKHGRLWSFSAELLEPSYFHILEKAMLPRKITSFFLIFC